MHTPTKLETFAKAFCFGFLGLAFSFLCLIGFVFVWGGRYGQATEEVAQMVLPYMSKPQFWLFCAALTLSGVALSFRQPPSWMLTLAKYAAYVLFFPIFIKIWIDELLHRSSLENPDGSTRYPEGTLTARERVQKWKAKRDQN